MKKLLLILLKIIIVIACVVGFAFGGAFIGLEAYDRHLIGRHYSGFFPGLEEALLGLCIGAIIGGVVGYKIIKPKQLMLAKAASRGNIQAVKKHIAAGMDVNAKNKYEATPLHYAKTKEIAELLIAKGANVNTKDDVGKTPLDWAVDETADLLRKHGGKTRKELRAAGK